MSMLKLALGTAQLGMPYGRTNQLGKPSTETALDLLKTAVSHGVSLLDCAMAYGNAEETIGQFLLQSKDNHNVTVVTKLLPTVAIHHTNSSITLQKAVQTHVANSCMKLQLPSLPVLLLHEWSHRTIHNEIIWKTLLQLKAEGKILKLGASVQSPQEAIEAFSDPNIQFIQLPFNLLDWRWLSFGIDQYAFKRPDVFVQARSALLQGIIAAPPDIWPKTDNFDTVHVVKKLDTLTKAMGRHSRIDLAYAYVKSQKWIHSVVVGMESIQQLNENLLLFKNAPNLSDQQLQDIFQEMVNLKCPEHLLNPAKWHN